MQNFNKVRAPSLGSFPAAKGFEFRFEIHPRQPPQPQLDIRNWTGFPFKPNMPRNGEAEPEIHERLRDA